MQLTSIPVVKEEQSFGRINTQECRYIFVVRKRGTKSQKSDIFLCCFYVTNSSAIIIIIT